MRISLPGFVCGVLAALLLPATQAPAQNSNCTLVINCPSNIVVTSCVNVQEFYNPTASNICCGVNSTVSCTPPSGSIFAVGTTTTVNCTATDCAQNTNYCSFTVTVLMGTNCATNYLQVQCPSNIVLTSCTNTQVYYAPTVTDSNCSNWTIVCSPPSGSFFAPNTTNLVDCYVTDYCGESNDCSFTVTVLQGPNCATNCIILDCPSNIVLTTCSNCAPAYYAATAVNSCCFDHVVLHYDYTSGTCFPIGTTPVQVTAYDPDCASTPPTNCTFTVTVIQDTNCCTNQCCGPGLGAETIQWLDLPTRLRLQPNPFGSNTSGTWIITNLPCYGNVLVVQAAPTNVITFCSNGDFGAYHAISSFDLVPNTNGQFDFTETQPGPYGPYSWGVIPGQVELGYEIPYLSGTGGQGILPPYNVSFYFLDGQPNPCSLVLSTIGLAQNTTNTLSQPFTFRSVFDLLHNPITYPTGPSADTMVNGQYGSALTNGISGTVIGSAYAINGGDDFNTGWSVLQPAAALQTTNLPPGSGVDINGNPYPALGSYPYINVTVNHELHDIFSLTVGYICCPCSCLSVQCPTNKTVQCTDPWSFDLPVASSCCTSDFSGTTSPPTNILITSLGITTVGSCPVQDVTQTWFIQDACGNSNFCSQTVTVLGCCSNSCIELSCPSNISVTTCDLCVPVNYAASAVDTCCTNSTGGSGLSLSYNPPPGTCFYPGTTPVQVTASDSCGNSNSCSFTVTVAVGTNCCTNTVTNINLNTGYDPNSNNVYGFGQADATWWVTRDPSLPPATVPRPATVVNPNPAWDAAQPNSGWISSYATDADTFNGEYDFQTYFCTAPDATNLVLSICLRADDAAAAALNGHIIPLSPANTAFNAPNPACGTAINPAWFIYGGQNILTVYVTNLYGVAMGLNAEASVSGTGLLPVGSPCCALGSGISGQKFYDMNCNGAQDPGEPGLSGWTIQLSNGTNIVTDVTDVNGYYYFTNLPPGTYTVTEVQQAGWAQSAPVGGSYTVTLTNLQQIDALNFGNCYTNINTNCIILTCPSNIVATTCSNCAPVFFAASAYDTCCSQGPAGAPVNIAYSWTPGSCFGLGVTTVLVTATDPCSNTATCSFTVTVNQGTNCCTNQCCGPGLGLQTINWLQFPPSNAPVLLPDPSGANTNGTWIITNLPCYGNVLVTQTFPPAPSITYWFLNANFENVSNAYGLFKDMEAGYGPYAWGTYGSLLDFYDGAPGPINYTVNFYFLDGQPNPCTLYLAVIGLASGTTTTLSQPMTFRGEYDLNANAPGGNGYASAYTSMNGTFPAAGLTGTNVGSAWSLTTNFGDPVNTGWALLQPTNDLATTTLPPGSGPGWPGALANVPYLTLTVNQQSGDGIAFTLGNVCCTNCNCLQVQCPTNKTVDCGTGWAFDPPIASSCCASNFESTGTLPTNVLVVPLSTVTNGTCPQVTVTQTWAIIDACGNSNQCSQVVTVLGCCTNPCLAIECPTNIVVTTCSNCAPVFYSATATVNGICCTNVSGTNYSIPSGSCFPIGTTTVQVTVFACGFLTNCDFTVTVNPCSNCFVVDCPTNKTVECGSNWTFDLPTASTCCPDGVVHIISLGAGTNGVCPKYASNTWAVFDDCGHSNTCQQVVTIVDTIPPVINCPTNSVVVTLNSNCDLVIPGIQVTASDNCTPPCDLIYTQSPTNGTIISGTTAYVTVTVTDLCGLSSSCTVLVVGVPKAALIVDWPANVTSTNCLVPCVSVIAHDCACPLQIPRVTQSPPCGASVGPGVTSVTVTVTDCTGQTQTKVIPLIVTGEESFLSSLANTGISSTGLLLAQDAVDPHYTLGPVPAPPPAGYTVPHAVAVTNLWPWLELPTHVSEWIAPATDDPPHDYLGSCPAGYYTYTNHFTLPAGANPATASISGRWAADDGAVAMYLNGFATGNTIPLASGWGMWTHFTINSHFTSGQNTLLFVVTNAAAYDSSPTGLRVEFTNASLCSTCVPPVVNWTTGWQTVQEGSLASFNIGTGGTPPFTYQWQLNGANISSATNASVQVSDVTLANAGQYNVIVTGPCGTIIHQIPLNVSPQLPWPNAIWNIPVLTNPLAASFGPDLVSRATDSGSVFALGAGTTADFGLPNPGGQIVNVMEINPQSDALIQVPPVVESGEISDTSYTLIMDLYESSASSGAADLLYASDYITNLGSGGQDGLTFTLDASNYLHITTYSGGLASDNVSGAPMPLDAWNRVALVVQAPLADGTGGSVSGYLNGLTNVVAYNCPCCIAHITNILDWTASTPNILSGPANGIPSGELYLAGIQFHAVAMTPQMIAGIGSPDAGPAPINETSLGAAPLLSAALVNGAVKIAWFGSPYVLQETTDVSSENWTDSALPFTERQTKGGLQTVATVSSTTAGPDKFYRLIFRP